MFQQNQQLPFSADNFQSNMLNLNLNNPPYVPQYMGPPQMQQVAPLIAAMAAIEIQNNAQKNNLRLFMFNMYSQNNFANAEFDALVKALLDYILFEVVSRRYPDPGSAAQICVPYFVGLCCALLVQQFPMLEGYTNSQMLAGIRNEINMFSQLANNITMMKNNMGNQNQQVQMNPNQFNNQNMLNTRGGFQQNVMCGIGGNNNNMQNTGLFSNANTTSNVGSGVGGSAIGHTKYGPGSETPAQLLQQPFNARNQAEPPVLQQQNKPNVVETKEVNAIGSGISWNPIEKSHYFPAYNPFIHDLIYKLDKKNKIIDIKLVEKEDIVMDYERHSLSTVFGPIPKDKDISDTVRVFENIRKGVAELNEAGNALLKSDDMDEALNTPEISKYIMPGVITETSLEEAWLVCGLDRLQTCTDVPDVYRAYARIAEPILCMTDESEVIKSYGASKTYIELREKMDSSVNEVSAALWSSANMKMVETINRILKQNLSIPDLSIESFVNDIQELIEVLQAQYGDAIKDSFLRHQRNHISSAFVQMYPESANSLTECFMDSRKFAEGVDPKIMYLCSDYSLTYLNCAGHELEIQLSDCTASIVTETLAPTMFELIKGLFSDVERHPDCNAYCRHLIRTSDSRILECSLGHLGDDAYLLTLIK